MVWIFRNVWRAGSCVVSDAQLQVVTSTRSGKVIVIYHAAYTNNRVYDLFFIFVHCIADLVEYESLLRVYLCDIYSSVNRGLFS